MSNQRLTRFAGPLVFLWFTLAASPAYALKCIVFSGLARDDTGAFSDNAAVLKPGFKIQNTVCQFMDSWSDISHADLGKAQEPVVLLEFAHGDHGGAAACNREMNSPEQIEAGIQMVADKNHPVAVVLDSCYSADILKMKLIDESYHPEASSADRVCLATTSSFGRRSVSNSWPNLLKNVNKGDSFESTFLKANIGLISSAAWNQSGISNYMVGESVPKAIHVLDQINKTVAPCADAYEQGIMSILTDPVTQTQRAAIIQAYAAETDALKLAYLDFSGDLFQEARKTGEDHSLFNFKATAAADCFQGFAHELNVLESGGDSDFNRSARPFIGNVTDWLTDLEKGPTFKKCNAGVNGFFGPLRSWRDIPHVDKLRKTLDNFRNLQATLQGVAVKQESPDGLTQVILSELNSAGNSKKAKPADTDPFMTVNLFADGFLGDDADDTVGLSPRDKFINDFSTSFVRGSAAIGHYSDPVDARRRSACRNFRF